ncbi:MAG TPA: universal stress protein [Chitinophagales bacterium]|jgi:nucleotide-binding universal stress UspA family protein|nr:universal stress protein [Chitinophagales bacterium]
MKKIIVTIDALTYNEHALEYAIGIARRSGGMVLGVFLHDMSYIYADLPGIFDLVPVEYNNIIKKQHEDHEKLELNLKLFNERCNQENIKHKAHFHDGTDIVNFLVNESVFADILILDEHMSFTNAGAHQLSNFIVDVLEDAHCPVLVVPRKFELVDNVFLCYDGTPSSVHAIKMYSYLFPEWNEKPTTLVTFNSTSSNHLSSSENIKDLLHQHFSNLIFDVEHEKRAANAVLSFFKLYQENAFVVMGAYGRSQFSRLLKKSLANTIIKEIKVPVFITHE